LEYKYIIENKSTHPLPPPEEGIKKFVLVDNPVLREEGKIRH